LQELGVTRAATIDSGDAYTEGFTQVFKQVFTELGGEIVLSAAVTRGDSDMYPVLTAVANSEAELLFFPLYQPEADYVVLQAKEMAGLGDLILIGNLLLDAFIESVGTAGVGMYFVGPTPVQNPANDELISRFESRYGVLPASIRYSYTYDATNLLLAAIESVAEQEKDGMLHIGRQALRDAMYATTGFEGVTGALTCDEFGDCAVDSFSIMRLDDPDAGLEGLQSNVIFTHTIDSP
jgi:branched-chain amino acid transport system substrate-binding protein